MMTLAVAFLGIITVSADNDQPININQLPAQAKMFLDKNFKGKKIAATTTAVSYTHLTLPTKSLV